MINPALRPPFVRHVLDFALGLALFFTLIGPVAIGESGAFPAPPPAELIRPDDTKYANVAGPAEVAAFRTAVNQPEKANAARDVSVGLLGLIFATLTAFNLFLLRHFRYVRAIERRLAVREPLRKNS